MKVLLATDGSKEALQAERLIGAIAAAIGPAKERRDGPVRARAAAYLIQWSPSTVAVVHDHSGRDQP